MEKESMCTLAFRQQMMRPNDNRFGSVSLFNGISTFVGCLIPKPTSRKTVVVLFNP